MEHDSRKTVTTDHAFEKAYAAWWIKLIASWRSAALFEIDFQASWCNVLWDKRVAWISLTIGMFVANVFYTTLPLLVGRVLATRSTGHFCIFAGVFLLILLWEYVLARPHYMMIFSTIQSVRQSAYRLLLTVDPQCHATRASGQIFSKIDRATKSFDELIEYSIYWLLPGLVGIITVIIACAYTDGKLGAIALCTLVCTVFFNTIAVLWNNKVFRHRIIATEDDERAATVESIMQVHLIRASLISVAWYDHVRGKNTNVVMIHWAYRVALYTILAFTVFAYGASFILIGMRVVELVYREHLSVVEATALLATYVMGTQQVFRIGRLVQIIAESIANIRDLFDFLRAFGTQTFPVLPIDPGAASLPATVFQDCLRRADITMHIENLHIAYGPDKIIYNHHALHLSVDRGQENKLYGIIGPSGSGKTTLLLVIGGQLRPHEGSVLINSIPVYDVDDEHRRKLIALQVQSIANMRGSLRDNLLMGLPLGENPFGDQELINVLARVGLWQIFSSIGGLDASVGEGGLTLSMGQRQRLNFVSLYLRARYYEPLVVLIDEPTSSLDECSEQAITSMIEELAHKSLTLVVAHRLKTLQNAVGILDCSLVSSEQEMHFYSPDELRERSVYYRSVRSGHVVIDEPPV